MTSSPFDDCIQEGAQTDSSESGKALNFIIWSTTEPTVALICACLPAMRKLFTARVAKRSSYVGAIRLDLRNSQPDESMSRVELSPANRNSANEVSIRLSRKWPTSSKLEKSQRSPPKTSPNKYAASRGGFQEETRPGHHVRMINSTDSDIYSRDEMKPGFKTPETPNEVQSAWSESGSDVLSFNGCDISSVRSKYGGAVKKPG